MRKLLINYAFFLFTKEGKYIDLHKYETYYFWIKELFLLAKADYNLRCEEGYPIKWGKLEEKTQNNSTWKERHWQHRHRMSQLRMQEIQLVWNLHALLKNPQNLKCLDLHCPRQRTVTQSNKGLVKIAEDASPRRHAENSPVNVKDTHLMNNKLSTAEILCGEWPWLWPNFRSVLHRTDHWTVWTGFSWSLLTCMTSRVTETLFLATFLICADSTCEWYIPEKGPSSYRSKKADDNTACVSTAIT